MAPDAWLRTTDGLRHAILIYEAGNEILQVDALNRTNIFGYDATRGEFQRHDSGGESK